MAQQLAARIQVTVLVGRPSSPRKHRPPYAWLESSRDGSFLVERVGTTAFEHKPMLGRVANYFTYMLLALFRILTNRQCPSVIIAMTDPPLTCLIAVIASRMKGCRFVYSIQDLHPDMALSVDMVKPGWMVSIWQWIHIWAMSKANAVIVLGDDMRDRIISKGIDPAHVTVVRHGAEPMKLPVPDGHPLVREIRSDFPFVVVYSGNLGFAGAWESIIDAARHMIDEGVRFVFVGEGTQRSRIEALASELPNVSFLPFRSQEEFPYVLVAGDLYIVTLRSGLEGLVVPSKVYPILMAGRPVLAVAPEKSDVAKLIGEYQCGLLTDPDNPESVVKAVLYARDHPQELVAMGQRAATLGNEFTHSNMADEFFQVLEPLLGN